MSVGVSALSILVGVVGGVLLVVSVLLARRRGFRRSVGVAGAGLLLLGLTLSGLVDAVSRALAILSFNPLRWAGLAAALLGAAMLSWAGLLPGRRRGAVDRASRGAPTRGEVRDRRSDPAREPADPDLAEIEDILRRRGIE